VLNVGLAIIIATAIVIVTTGSSGGAGIHATGDVCGIPATENSKMLQDPSCDRDK